MEETRVNSMHPELEIDNLYIFSFASMSLKYILSAFPSIKRRNHFLLFFLISKWDPEKCSLPIFESLITGIYESISH